jgi:hypothetical protein
LGNTQWRDGTDGDTKEAASAINDLTTDDLSIDLLFALARRRAEHLVEYYWPEIEKVAEALLAEGSLAGQDVERFFAKSVWARNVRRISW